jgi:hypothetical protein
MDIDNTSGQGPASRVPPELQRWNWGAFLLNWIWGLGNNTLVALLMFVPLVNVVFAFVLGAKGNEWAWRSRQWQSVEHFRAVQRRWAQWGVALWLVSIALFALLFVGIFAALKDSDAYKLAQAKLMADARVAEIVGTPLSTGFPSGSVQVSGPDGSASLSFGVEGPKGKGTAFIKAHKDMGRWQIDRLVFEDDATGRRIELAPVSQELAAPGSV